MSNKIFIDGDFNDSYESRIRKSKGKGRNKAMTKYKAEATGEVRCFEKDELKVKEEKK